jgi:hypothetical protein
MVLSIYMIRPMNRASIAATPSDGVRAMAAPVVDGEGLLVPVLEPVEVPFDATVVSEPPSTAVPGRFAEALAARAV